MTTPPIWLHYAEHLACTTESLVPPTFNLRYDQKLKPASLMHGGGWQGLEKPFDHASTVNRASVAPPSVSATPR